MTYHGILPVPVIRPCETSVRQRQRNARLSIGTGLAQKEDLGRLSHAWTERLTRDFPPGSPMKVPAAAKLDAMQEILLPVLDMLGKNAEDGDLTADDIIDFFAIGIAAVIDNDTNLTTPGDLRKAAQVATKMIEGRVKELRALQAQEGQSFLDLVISGTPMDLRHRLDS